MPVVRNPVYGPLIVGWRERRAIPLRAKVFCMLGLATTTIALFVLAVPTWMRVVWLAGAAITAWWVARRPVR